MAPFVNIDQPDGSIISINVEKIVRVSFMGDTATVLLDNAETIPVEDAWAVERMRELVGLTEPQGQQDIEPLSVSADDPSLYPRT